MALNVLSVQMCLFTSLPRYVASKRGLHALHSVRKCTVPALGALRGIAYEIIRFALYRMRMREPRSREWSIPQVLEGIRASMKKVLRRARYYFTEEVHKIYEFWLRLPFPFSSSAI